MRYYTIKDKVLLIAETEQALSRYYDEVEQLPEDYAPNKYIVKEVETEIEVPEYDEDGNIIGYHTEIKCSYELVLNPDYEAQKIAELKTQLNAENIAKAKLAVENGFVEFKNAQFETNAQTVSDLTATMLLMQSSGLESYQWLSKDDKIIELTLADFGSLGGLIAGFKAHVWSEEYLTYKTQIDEAQTIQELAQIKIIY